MFFEAQNIFRVIARKWGTELAAVINETYKNYKNNSYVLTPDVEL